VHLNDIGSPDHLSHGHLLEQVLKALGDAATKLRGKLGESLVSVQKYDVAPASVTTSSLEALQAYTLGAQASLKNDRAAAMAFYHKAVDLDPNFAMAYARLGMTSYNAGESARAAENMHKAYELRGRTSQQEKLLISSFYEVSVNGNLEAARTAYELWAQTYPRDVSPQRALCSIYSDFGEFEKALAAAREALRLDPKSGGGYGNLVASYMWLNRWDEAEAVAQEARNHNLFLPHINLSLYVVDFLQHDAAGVERVAAELRGKRGFEDEMLYFESEAAAYGGEFVKARELTHRAIDSAQPAGKGEAASLYEAEGALREVLAGNVALAKQRAQEGLTRTTGKDARAMLGITLGLAGDSAQAALLAGDLAKRYPEDTIVQTQYLPMIHAAVELQRGGADKAVEALRAAAPYELGQYISFEDFALYPVYLRGEAYLASRQGAAAAGEFQKILDHPGVVMVEPIGALAHLGLGRARALTGESAKATTAYQDFLALWKNADADIPILRQAQAEYAKLK
jgi:tetratricopeptide (TPR) repeat protein